MDDEQKRSWVRGLFLQYEGRLLRYTMKFTSHDKASEIVQESFVKLLKMDNPSKIAGKELPWLFRVCRNRSLDRLKKEKPMSLFKPGEEIPFESESVDEKIERDQKRSEASEILQTLTPTQKEVVRLKFQEELSYKEISDVTGHSVSHVGVILHEAIKKLRAQVNPNKLNKKGGK